MQFSLFSEEPKKDENKYFFMTHGFILDQIKYGKIIKEIKENMASKTDDKETILKQLQNYGYTQTKAEELVQKTIDNENSWYNYIEQMYIF